MKIHVVINWSILIRFVWNLSCSMYIVLDIPLCNSPLNWSHFPIDQWFNNLTWYQILVQDRNKSCLISIVHQKQLSFHINLGIIALLPLDSSREVYPCVTDSKKVHMVRWKGLNWHMIANWIGFVVFFACIYVTSWGIDLSTYKKMDSSALIPQILTPFNYTD